jgi:hypothetical protein
VQVIGIRMPIWHIADDHMVARQRSAGKVAAVNATQQDAATERLSRAVDRLVAQVAHWQPDRWTGGPDESSGRAEAGRPDVGGSRADRVFALVQRLADRCADAEGRPPMAVPRLGDLVLPDQLRVVARDLRMAGGAAEVSADDVDGVRRTL